MITRRIGKLILGKATPAQLMLACVLGAMLGMMPGFFQAAGLIVVLVLLLIILNANLALAGIALVIAKIISYPLLPVSFMIGQGLLDGPTQPLFKWLINTPVLALFGFDYYATTGALVLGLILGLLAGWGVVVGIRRFRKKMAALEAGSPAYQKWAGKWWVKLVMFIIFGKGKADFAKLAAAKGKVIRPIGVAAAVLVVALLVIVDLFFSGPIVTAALQRGLQQANGATVDIGSAQVDLAHGKMRITNLALADPNALNTNLLQAKTVVMDIDVSDLLRKRITLDKVELVDAAQGAKRAVPGHLIGNGPTPTPESSAPKPKANQKTIEDYLKDAKTWKDRLAQLRRWLDELDRSHGKSAPSGTSGQGQSHTERIAHQVDEYGYAGVRAAYLVEGAPTFTVRELIADGVQAATIQGQTLNIHGENLSTQPWLLDKPATLSVKSSGGTLLAKITLHGQSGAQTDAAGGTTAGVVNADHLQFAYHGLKTDAVAGQLKVAGDKPLVSGGTIDLTMSGTFTPAALDLPLHITLHNTTVAIPGAGAQRVDELILPITLTGPMDNPRITLSKQQIADALKKAGADMLADKLKGEAGKQIEKVTGKLGDKIGQGAAKEIGQQGGAILQGLFGGKKDKK